MKLLNHTLLYLSVSLLAILSIWAVVFYFDMLEEVKDSIDDGLENYKMLLIYKAQDDPAMLQSSELGENNYIKEISPGYASQVRDTYKDTMVYMKRQDAYEPLRLLTTAFAARDGKYYEMKVISPVVDKGELIRKLLYALIGLYLIILASMIIVNNFVLKKIWKPFYNVLDQLKDFKLGAPSVFHSSKTRVREFQVLNDAIGSLLMRNLETFNSQKQFIENASHELQTPLAISINKLELLAEKNNRTEEDVQIIGNIIKTLEGLTRLNRSLLLLSKIENKQFIEEGVVSFNKIINRLKDDFSDLAEFRNVKITSVEKGEWTNTMNRDLAEILVMNLLKNAITHNYSGGEVAITITPLSFTIENTGEDVPMDNDRMFERFYKKSAENSSTGLGLAIVKAITNFYGLSVIYRFTGRHSITVSLQQ